jgi:hypothetical protein
MTALSIASQGCAIAATVSEEDAPVRRSARRTGQIAVQPRRVPKEPDAPQHKE